MTHDALVVIIGAIVTVAWITWDAVRRNREWRNKDTWDIGDGML